MKHLARKHVNGASQQQNKFLRVSQCKEEIYGYILRLLGNGMCMVKCVDGYERLCHIRGKFTGRSKRENALSQGTWVLIGLRQWDADKEFALKTSKTPGKSIQKCDLLEIYTPAEREKLRVQEKIFQENADENGGGGNGGGSDSDDEFRMSKQTVEFKDQATLEYQEIIEQGGKLSRMKKTSYHDIYEGITSDTDSDDDSDHPHDTTAHQRDHPHDGTAPHDTSSRHDATTAHQIQRSVPDLPKQQQQQQKQQKMVFDEVDIDEI